MIGDAPRKISVCLATWNGERYLREQIDSVLSQLGPGDELVVSDDGSTDATRSILEGYGKSLRVVSYDPAGGVVRNFERALSAATGDLIVLCDQDDVWLGGRLDLVREGLSRAHLLMMNGEVVDELLRPMGKDVFSYVKFRQGFVRVLISNRYVGCCMAFRRELLRVTLPFPRGVQWHDWYMALVAELLYSAEFSRKKTMLYRRHGSNASLTGEKSDRRFRDRLISRVLMVRAILIAMFRKACA